MKTDFNIKRNIKMINEEVEELQLTNIFNNLVVLHYRYKEYM